MSWNKAFDLCVKLKEDFIREYVVKRQDESLLNIPFKEKIKLMKRDNIFVDKMFDNVTIKQYGNILVLQGDMYGEKKLVLDIEEEKIMLSKLRKFEDINNIDFRTVDNIEVSEKVEGKTICYCVYNDKIYDDNGKVVKDTKVSDILLDYPNHTFIFKEKVNDKREGLHLVGIKNLSDGFEYEYSTIKAFADSFGIFCARKYFFYDIEAVIEYSKANEVDFVISMGQIKVQTTQQ